MLKYKLAMSVLFFAGLGLTYFVFTRVPTGFVPDEDQGYFIIVIQAPSGASLEYTKSIGKQISDVLAHNIPESEGTFSVAGFSFAGAAANQGLIFVPLKPYSQRKGDEHAAPAIVNRVRPMLFGISGSHRVCHAATRRAGLGTLRRIPVCGAGPEGAQTRGAGRGHARIDPRLPATKGSGRPQHTVHGKRSAVYDHDRSRKSEEPARASVADYGHARRIHGLGIRERF